MSLNKNYNKSAKKLMVMAGGTGGHVFPGLTVSHYLMNHGWKIRWLGTANHIESSLVPKHGIEIDFIAISSLRGKSVKELLLITPMQIIRAWYRARDIMIHFKPDVVLGMGGYVSGPGGLAAWSLGIPIVLHEQNSIAGITNKLLAKIARKVLQAFPSAFKNAEVVGNPIRTDILTIPKPEFRLKSRQGPLRILVIGGSQGAQILNQTMPKVAKNLREVIIWHQSGEKFLEHVQQAYSSIGQSQHIVTGFISNIANAYKWADIVICRSGALTVSEIIASGLPAIFVPFQHNDRQQYWNALPLKKAGAAKILSPSECTSNVISSMLSSLDRQILLEMANRARAIPTLNATERIAEHIKYVANT